MSSIILSVGRDQYRPPPALAKLVKWRADRCMGPGCGMPGGAIPWTSPAGRRYLVKPERAVPVFRSTDHGDAPRHTPVGMVSA
ncbi:hypothetical protein [Microbacterium sp. LWH3-1.2]|uniref:hypothetical protein n=1 Tax=Microbacterium sp. LWH3-1.2 TaxID=3135256 RepID=UPI0034390F50